MNIDNLVKNYEKRKSEIVKWERSNEPQGIRKRKRITIIVGAALLIIMGITILTVKKLIYQLAIYGAVALIFIIYIVRFRKWLDACTGGSKKLIYDGDKKRSKALKRLLIEEGIDANSVETISIVISAVQERKEQILSLKDIYRFVVLPFIIIVVPMYIVFFDHLTCTEDIVFQARFLLDLTALLLIFSVLCFMIVDPMRWLIYRKYDEIIELLELLKAMK